MQLTVRRSWGEVIIGCGLLAGAGSVATLAAALPAGEATAPGPRAFPLALAGMLGVAALGVIARGIVRSRRAEDRFPVPGADPAAEGAPVSLALTNPLLFVIALAAAAALFEPAGFAVTTVACLSFLFAGPARLSPLRTVAWALAVTALFWGVFVVLLGVRLPPGVLGS